jgi:hydrogenase-4 component F
MFTAAGVYAFGYLRHSPRVPTKDIQEDFLFTNEPEAVFAACLLGFLATMSLVCISRHLGLLWVAVEATTLVSAPLIYYHRHHRSLEATWKYLLICSVGIALAMLGNFCLAFAARGIAVHLNMNRLVEHAASLDPTWLKAAFLMMLVGYGTKMGLAPMHNWLPDAHSEAPSLVSALLSGALLNCAFLAILRVHEVLTAAGMAPFSGELMVVLGLVSMGVAAVFLIRQADYKRMLAYSSIEHMGILALGVGLGGSAVGGSLLHAVNHSMTKGLLFLVAGNLLTMFQTKEIGRVRGLLKSRPLAGMLWLAGFLAITGSPPFGTFLSELTILRGALEQGRWWVAGGYLLALGVIFVAMARIFLPMVFGIEEKEKTERGQSTAQSGGDSPWAVASPIALGVVVLVLGLWVPGRMWEFLKEAGGLIGGR